MTGGVRPSNAIRLLLRAGAAAQCGPLGKRATVGDRLSMAVAGLTTPGQRAYRLRVEKCVGDLALVEKGKWRAIARTCPKPGTAITASAFVLPGGFPATLRYPIRTVVLTFEKKRTTRPNEVLCPTS